METSSKKYSKIRIKDVNLYHIFQFKKKKRNKYQEIISKILLLNQFNLNKIQTQIIKVSLFRLLLMKRGIQQKVIEILSKKEMSKSLRNR